MSASGMPLTLNNGRITRILEGTDSLYAQSITPSTTDANLLLVANGNGETRLGAVGKTTRVLGNLNVDGTETVTGGATFNGNVTLGDNSGDTIQIGGGTTDGATLACDLTINNAVDVRFARATGTGVMVLPDGSVGEAGAIRVNSSNELQWWNGSAWATAGTSTAQGLQLNYEQVSTISTNGTGGDLQFTVTTNGDFDILNGADSWGFNYGAADQLNVVGVLQAMTIDTAGAISLDAGAASNFSTSAGDIDISAGGELDLDGATNVAINAASGNMTIAQAGSGTMDLDAAGAISINSSAGVINVGNDAVAQNINIGTGAAARTIAIGNTTGATAVTVDAGSGGISLDTAAASNFTVSGATADLTLGARGTTITLNESGETSLDGTFTATSIIGALNELADDVSGVTHNTLDQAYDQGGAGSGRVITADSGAVEINGANAADYGLEVTNSGNGGALFVNSTGTGAVVDLQDGGSNVFQIADGGAFDIDSAAFDLDASGAVTIDSTSTIGIGANAAAGDISIGTNATARTITIGNSTGATALDLDAGTGGVSIDTAGASNFTVSGATADLTLGARGATVTLNESGQTSLSGFTATSIIGSLNELKGEISGVGTWEETADEVIAANDIIALDDSAATGKVVKANAGTVGQDVVMGVATAGASAGGTVTIQSGGKVSVTTSDAGAWTVGQDVFMSGTDGEVTSTPPTSGNVQRVGQSLDTGTAGTRSIALLIGEPVDL